MNMKKSLISITFLLQSILIFSQVPENFNDCEYDMFLITAETYPKWKVDSISITDYFNSLFAGKHELKGVNGKIYLGILILESGKTCCMSFTNLTNSNLNSDIFKTAVNNMPDWIPAKQKKTDIIFLHNLILYIEDGKFVQKK